MRNEDNDNDYNEDEFSGEIQGGETKTGISRVANREIIT